MSQENVKVVPDTFIESGARAVSRHSAKLAKASSKRPNEWKLTGQLGLAAALGAERLVAPGAGHFFAAAPRFALRIRVGYDGGVAARRTIASALGIRRRFHAKGAASLARFAEPGSRPTRARPAPGGCRPRRSTRPA